MPHVRKPDYVCKNASRQKLFIKIIKNISIQRKPCSAGKYQLKKIARPTAFKQMIFTKFFLTSYSLFLLLCLFLQSLQQFLLFAGI